MWQYIAEESQILRRGEFGLARDRLFLLYLRFQSSGSNSVVECQLPKLDVAGSNPVSRSIFSIIYENFPHPPHPPFIWKYLILSYLWWILPTQHGLGLV
jgi:hypothetical protein